MYVKIYEKEDQVVNVNMKYVPIIMLCLRVYLQPESLFIEKIVLNIKQDYQEQQSLKLILMGKKKGNQKRQESDQEQKQQKPTEEKQTETKEQEKGQTKEQNKEVDKDIIAPKKVAYCPVCSFPFQLCKYGKNPNECVAFLFKLAPAKVIKYHPNFNEAEFKEVMKNYKRPETQQEVLEKQEKGKPKTIKEKFIVIEVKNRGRKHYITNVTGLKIFGIDAKDMAKKCSKKFSLSCSAVQDGVVTMQGDNLETVKDFLINEYKVKKKYIIDKEQYTEKNNEEIAKKKEAKKKQEMTINEVNEEQEEQKKQPEKTLYTIRMEMMQKADEQDELQEKQINQ